MRADEFDYHLPPELIAQRPLADRSASRLLYLEKTSGESTIKGFRESIDLLEPGDLLVVNETRVTAFRLLGTRATGGKSELLVLRPEGDGWLALAKPAKKLPPGATVSAPPITATILEERGEGRKIVRLDSAIDLNAAIAEAGAVPLPPYIWEDLQEGERYQTVYARTPGSAAAPTAGLHFTQEMLDEITAKGVGIARVSLDVSVDTFRPVSADDLADHTMHGETCRISEEDAATINAATGRIIAVGTTAVRTLESFSVAPRQVEPGEKSTQLFITPGYEWRMVDGMFTNFHMPRTTMLAMISALAGIKPIRAAYELAVEERMRFLSFGDSMLIL